jgi:hypothetical protein
VAQGDRSFEAVVVVLRRVRRVAGRPARGSVHENRHGRVAAIDGRRVDDRLERGSHLAVGLRRAIELAALEAVAADHRADLTGAIVDREDRPFDGRWLFE